MAFGLGESVGTAYVRIIADGTGLDQSIRDEFDDVDMRSIGQKGGTEYQKGFDNAIKDHKFGRTIEQSLRRGVGRFNALGEFAGSDLIKGLRDKLKADFGDEIGGVIHDELQEELDSQRLDYSGLRNRLENGLGPAVARATRKVRAQQQKVLDQMLADQEKYLNDEEELYRDHFNERARMYRESAVDALNSLKARSQIEKEEWDRRDRDFEAHIRRGATGLRKFANQADEFGDTLGRAFGTGSRNNFFNLFGRFVSIVPRAAAGFARLASSAKGFADIFSKAFTEGGGGLKGFQAGLGALSKAAGPALAGGIAAAAAAIVALEVAASTASLAVGGLVAIIGTVGSGLIGGVGLLAASLVPLAAGIGSVVVAWQSLTDVQKKAFNEGITPLTDAFGRLGDIAGAQIFTGLGDELAKMAPFMDSLAEATTLVTAAVREQIDSWVALVNSGAFNAFRDTIARDLPGQIGSMGGIFQNFATIFTGFFNAISPVLSKFLADLDKITGRFSEWINSAQGNKAVTDFFDSAYESVKAIGDVLVSAGRLLGNFFRIGAEGGGNELFRDLASTFRDWNEALIENEEEIKAWVEDGADFVRALGKVVEGIVALVAALDTPFMRTVITASIESMALAFKGLALAIEGGWAALKLFEPLLAPMKLGLDNLGASINFVWDQFARLDDLPGPLGAGFGAVGDAIGFVGDKLGFAGDEAKSAKGPFDDFADSIFEGMRDGASSTQRLARTVATAATRVAELAEKQREARKAARDQASSFIDISEAADDAKTSLNEWIKIMEDQAKALRDYTKNLQSAADNGVRKGLLNALKELGPEGARRVQQLADATDNQVERANKAWARGRQAIRDYAQAEVPPKKIEVDTDDAVNDVDNLQGKINGLTGKTVTVTVNAALNALNSAASRALGAIRFAQGGVVAGPTRATIGEAGPEAIVPLRRPLGMVDPSVRELSAFAQGVPFANGGIAGAPSKTLNVGPITINTPTENPRAVAVETINRLALVGGF